jgi:hypothetical protein
VRPSSPPFRNTFPKGKPSQQRQWKQASSGSALRPPGPPRSERKELWQERNIMLGRAQSSLSSTILPASDKGGLLRVGRGSTQAQTKDDGEPSGMGVGCQYCVRHDFAGHAATRSYWDITHSNSRCDAFGTLALGSSPPGVEELRQALHAESYSALVISPPARPPAVRFAAPRGA